MIKENGKHMTNVQWTNTEFCDPPHRVTHPEKFFELLEMFKKNGWDTNHPPLLGYWLENKIQLISGSHRWAAAKEAEIKIPILLHTYEKIFNIWGTEEWLHLLQSVYNVKYE